MSQYNESGVKTYEADGAIGQYLRVKHDGSGQVTLAGLTDTDIGAAERPSYAAGDNIPVRLRTAPGTCIMVASEAIAKGALLYSAASGKVSDQDGGSAVVIGHAESAATADGDLIEVLRS